MSKGEPGLYVSYCAKDFLDGTQMLGPWEELAYRRICDMIYATNDRLADDDRKLAWATKVGRRWAAVKQALTSGDKPKLLIVDGRITNSRCTDALQKAAQNMEQKSFAGNASFATGKSLKNLKQNRTGVGFVAPNGPPNQPLITEPKEEKGSLLGAQKETRATRLPNDFEVPAEWIGAGTEAREKARLPLVDLATEAVKFVNHFIGSGRPNAAKKDWRRTWLNWALNAKGGADGRSPQRKSTFDNFAEGWGRVAGCGIDPPNPESDRSSSAPLLDGEYARYDA